MTPWKRLLPTRTQPALQRHRSALAPEPSRTHSSGQVCPQTTLGAWVCCRTAVNWAVPIPATPFYHKPRSYAHEFRWDGHNNFSWPQNLCIQGYLLPGLWQGEFQQARLEIMGFSHIRATQITVPRRKMCSLPTGVAMTWLKTMWWEALGSRELKEELWKGNGAHRVSALPPLILLGNCEHLYLHSKW